MAWQCRGRLSASSLARAGLRGHRVPIHLCRRRGREPPIHLLPILTHGAGSPHGNQNERIDNLVPFPKRLFNFLHPPLFQAGAGGGFLPIEQPP